MAHEGPYTIVMFSPRDGSSPYPNELNYLCAEEVAFRDYLAWIRRLNRRWRRRQLPGWGIAVYFLWLVGLPRIWRFNRRSPTTLLSTEEITRYSHTSVRKRLRRQQEEWHWHA